MLSRSLLIAVAVCAVSNQKFAGYATQYVCEGMSFHDQPLCMTGLFRPYLLLRAPSLPGDKDYIKTSLLAGDEHDNERVAEFWQTDRD